MNKKPHQRLMCSAGYKIVKKYKMVKTQHNSVNGITFQTQSQSVDRDIASCQSAENG